MLSWIFRNRLRLRTIYGAPEAPPLPGARFSPPPVEQPEPGELDGMRLEADPYGPVPYGPVRHDPVRHDPVRPEPVRPGQIRYRPGEVWRTQRHTLMRPMPPRFV